MQIEAQRDIFLCGCDCGLASNQIVESRGTDRTAARQPLMPRLYVEETGVIIFYNPTRWQIISAVE